MSNLPVVMRVLWLSVAVLASVIVALLAFMLKRSASVSRNEAVFASGAAFAGCMVLCLGVLAAALG
ncbi:hypothetical protein ACIOGZ_36010 [Kitasatospora sp. NPDC088160]|uniref:hypothetical protein n=1 Tax=Kitasatospora sp. NPDC088160 TaxID=3364072 RepID=UPI0038039864